MNNEGIGELKCNHKLGNEKSRVSNALLRFCSNLGYSLLHLRDKTLCLTMATTLREEADVEAALQLAKDKVDAVEEDAKNRILPL
jgi:hypothetical protein